MNCSYQVIVTEASALDKSSSSWSLASRSGDCGVIEGASNMIINSLDHLFTWEKNAFHRSLSLRDLTTVGKYFLLLLFIDMVQRFWLLRSTFLSSGANTEIKKPVRLLASPRLNGASFIKPVSLLSNALRNWGER